MYHDIWYIDIFLNQYQIPILFGAQKISHHCDPDTFSSITSVVRVFQHTTNVSTILQVSLILLARASTWAGPGGSISQHGGGREGDSGGGPKSPPPSRALPPPHAWPPAGAPARAPPDTVHDISLILCDISLILCDISIFRCLGSQQVPVLSHSQTMRSQII